MTATGERFRDKVVVVTGGSRGIGLATAQAFKREGATLVITGRDTDRLDAAVRTLGSNVTAVPGDVSCLADLDRLHKVVRDGLGRVDVLFANAGLVHYEPFESISETTFDRVFAINVKGTFFTVQKILPLMPPGSAIVINSSVASIAGTPNGTLYGASKAAARALARNISSSLLDRRVRVNVVSPGPIHAPSSSGENRKPRAANRGAWILTVPIGRVGTPDEVAQAVLFLASDDSTFMVGSELVLDGGRTTMPDAAPIYAASAALPEAVADEVSRAVAGVVQRRSPSRRVPPTRP